MKKIISFNVNDAKQELYLDTRKTLLKMLREDLVFGEMGHRVQVSLKGGKKTRESMLTQTNSGRSRCASSSECEQFYTYRSVTLRARQQASGRQH